MASGLRVLQLAYRPEAASLHDAAGEPRLPSDLLPLGLLSMSDELRRRSGGGRHRVAGRSLGGDVLSGDRRPALLAALLALGAVEQPGPAGEPIVAAPLTSGG